MLEYVLVTLSHHISGTSRILNRLDDGSLHSCCNLPFDRVRNVESIAKLEKSQYHDVDFAQEANATE
ncbi:MAG: hypothetical protein WCG25_06490 [bacterium]